MDRATGTVASVLKKFEKEFSEVSLRPSGGGLFEITLDDKLIFSKSQVWRFPDEGEIVEIVSKALQP